MEHVKLMDRLRGRKTLDVSASYVTSTGSIIDPSTLPIASPWSTSAMARIVWSDTLGANAAPLNTRDAAMRISAVARGRNLMASTICRLPLVDLAPGASVPPVSPDAAANAAAWREFNRTQPRWLSRTDGDIPQHRMAWTVDDLMFYGWSCWWRRNDASTGFPLSVGRYNRSEWSVNDDHRVVVNGAVQDDNQVILIPGLHEGILSFGVDVLSDARALYRNVRARLAAPTPGLDLHQEEGREMTDDEIDRLIERWAAARRGENAGVSFTSKGIKANPMGDGDASLMIESRNAAALELARMIGVHAGLLDATVAKSSLNYETTTGRNQEFVDFDLALYMTPIAARLSMDDVTPQGHRVAWHLGDFINAAPSVTGPELQD